jgi:hypothetical protein
MGVQWMVDAITGESTRWTFDQAALLLVVAFAIQALFGMLRAWLFTLAGRAGRHPAAAAAVRGDPAAGRGVL